MSLDLESDTATVAEEPARPVEEDRDGCELIDGVWVEKSVSNRPDSR